MVDLIELLNECADALEVPTWDHENREEHLAYIEEALAQDTTSDVIRELLGSVATIFRTQQTMNGLSLAVEDVASAGQALATDIHSKLGWRFLRFIYHGTIFGRLHSISKDGLVPGKAPVWKEQHVPRQFANSAVFFSSTWRGAMLWAESAQAKAKGPRNGLHRSLVAIRIPTDGFTPELDPMANRPGCLMVRGVVPVESAEVIHGRVQGFPKWVSLVDVLGSKR